MYYFHFMLFPIYFAIDDIILSSNFTLDTETHNRCNDLIIFEFFLFFNEQFLLLSKLTCSNVVEMRWEMCFFCLFFFSNPEEVGEIEIGIKQENYIYF